MHHPSRLVRPTRPSWRASLVGHVCAVTVLLGWGYWNPAPTAGGELPAAVAPPAPTEAAEVEAITGPTQVVQTPPENQAPGAAAVLLAASIGTQPSPYQDSPGLHRIYSGLMPADGLLRVWFGLLRYGTWYEIGNNRYKIDGNELSLGLEYGLLPALHLRAEMPYRSWSGGLGPLPASGSGLGDGRLVAVLGLPRPTGFLGWSLWGGATFPTGDEAQGLSEGKTAPEAGLAVTLRFWERSSLPEMRVHLNAGHRWNRNEDFGYGFDLARGLQPWPPRYPSVADGRPPTDNDYLLLGGALEFRAETTALYLEYTVASLYRSSAVSALEYPRFLSAGLRWGKVEGWAVSMVYDISFALEDPGTPFLAAYPDLAISGAVSYQFPLGGRDTDGDGIPNRRDHCPQQAEDPDGFADQDGCPEWDNDADGIPDALDGAPLAPEDLDGFADEDGIPDPDNDGDGIVDDRDVCPDQAEDFDGHQDQDGCPEEFLDRDADGIEDAEDRCPGAPEDRDGFEDQDGCPESDNDLDGIDDGQDECPDDPEDYDGVDDEDGCPE